jgi:hypothetical protein
LSRFSMCLLFEYWISSHHLLMPSSQILCAT